MKNFEENLLKEFTDTEVIRGYVSVVFIVPLVVIATVRMSP